MREIKRILTDRNIEGEVFFDLVYEWENQLSKSLNVPLLDNWKLGKNRYFKRLPIPNVSRLLTKGKLSLYYRMSGFEKYNRWTNTRDIVPAIIDFYPTKEQIPRIEKDYKNNPLVLISSKEVYDFLKENHIKLPIEHWALSISDIYRITPDTRFEKKYDLVMMGRQNPVLLSYYKKYAETHLDFTYVYRVIKNYDDGHRDFFYYTSDGNNLGAINTREQFIGLMRQSRCGLYGTPGIDDDEKNNSTNGMHQVTPRFLEYIASGCHILARYPKNSDTDYFELDKFSPSIETYEQFEERMDYCRTHDVDMKFYSDYLKKHYTSTRAKELQDILKQY